MVYHMIVQITQTRQSFPFGSAIVANRIYKTDVVNRRYQAYFYDMFNWAVLTNAMKWRFMEGVEASGV